MTEPEILSTGLSIFALIISGFALYYSRRQIIVSTRPVVSITLDRFDWTGQYRGTPPALVGKLKSAEDVLQSTKLRLCIQNHSTSLEVVDVQLFVHVSIPKLFGMKQKYLFFEFAPFSIGAEKRHHEELCRYGRRDELTESFEFFLGRVVGLLERVNDSGNYISHFLVKEPRVVRLEVEAKYRAGVYRPAQQVSRKVFRFEPVVEDSILIDWYITDMNLNYKLRDDIHFKDRHTS